MTHTVSTLQRLLEEHLADVRCYSQHARQARGRHDDLTARTYEELARRARHSVSLTRHHLAVACQERTS